jgi:adenylate cyclase
MAEERLMDTSLAAYLPQDRRQALIAGAALPEHDEGSALFADIAGFTPLTEALDRALGARRGVEEMTRRINRVYDAMIVEIERYGGSVIGFAGDSITCWFDERVMGDGYWVLEANSPTPITQHPAPARAVACALALQHDMQQFATITLPNGSTSALSLKVAVASGPARRFVVGDPAIQLLDVHAGAPLARTAAGEHLTRPGEVLLDQPTATALGDTAVITEWRVDHETGIRFAVLRNMSRHSISRARSATARGSASRWAAWPRTLGRRATSIWRSAMVKGRSIWRARLEARIWRAGHSRCSARSRRMSATIRQHGRILKHI